MVIVTGATGLVGTHLLVELIPHHTTIMAFYRSDKKKEEAKKVLKYYGVSVSTMEQVVQWVQVDLLDLVTLKTLFKGARQVYHCAALVAFHKLDYSDLLLNNVQGTANVVNMCLFHKVEKLVHMSSVAALGGSDENGFVTEKSKWISYEGKSGYAISKKHGEREVYRGIEEGLNAVIVNPTVIFGAAGLKQSSIAIFDAVLKGQPFYTSGSNAIVDARDVAKVMRLLMNSELSNEKFLLVGKNTTFQNIMNEICKQSGKRKPFIKISGSILIPFVRVIENIGRLFKWKPFMAVDSASASVSSTSYSNAKVATLLDYDFITLEESVNNVLKYNKRLKD